MPKVSVVMTVRNGERFIQEAVDSILKQTFEDFELIVVDDDSTDSTKQILAEYQLRDSRLILDWQSPHRGVAVCRNLGNNRASGDYIAVMDADDISLPDRLEKQVAFLEKNPETSMVGSFAELIDENGKPKGYHRTPTEPGVLGWLLCFLNPFVHSSMMMRRQVVLALGGYRERIGAAEDLDLIARASVRSKVGIVPEVLIQYRDWGSSLTTRTRTELMLEVNRIMQFLAENYLHNPVSMDEINALRLTAWSQPLESLTQIRGAATLLDRLYDAYTQSVELSIVEARAIAEDVSLRKYALARRCLRISPYYALTLSLKGILKSPHSFRKIAAHYAR